MVFSLVLVLFVVVLFQFILCFVPKMRKVTNTLSSFSEEYFVLLLNINISVM